MRYPQSTFVSAIAIVWAFGAQARGVKFLDFSTQPAAVTPAGVSDRLDSNAAINGVAQSMRAHFEQSGDEGGDQGSPGFGMDLDNLPTREVFIPHWMRGRHAESLTIPSLPHRFESGLMQGSFEHCEGALYAPTWWLSRDVESRRAVHFETVAAIACEFGIPTALLDAIIAQESGYKSWAVSSAGAVGMMQIMPGTARLLGLALPFDPIANMRAGARYLRQQLDRFGRVDLALAAYNAGPERRSLRDGYIPTIPQTLDYVRIIQKNWARLSPTGVEVISAEARGAAAAAAVRASGYRAVELVNYDGLNAANPM